MKILDVTVRDGSYAVDFKYSRAEVKDIVSRLVRLGIEYIEIGHGMGLNASSPERGISLRTDEEYIRAAKEVAGESKIGVFCIPGIARMEDLKMAADHGVAFIRIGVPVAKIADALPYVKEAKALGMEVMVNFMKSYANTPADFAQSARTAYDAGADTVYLVDSAGYMLPAEITEFYNATKEVCPDVKLGFHGHNNIGYAVSNSMHCAELGFEFIDTSFQGLGRSIGNASTEMFVMAYERAHEHDGKSLGIDIPRLLEYGYVAMRDIMGQKVMHPLDLICGYTGFHTAFLKQIFHCCDDMNVDPLRLIVAYSKENKLTLDYDRLCEVAKTLPQDDFDTNPYNFRTHFLTIFNDR